MLKNEPDGLGLFAASAVGGIFALVANWVALDRTDGYLSLPLEWAATWSYGFALGAGAASVYVAGGGRSLGRAVNTSLAGALLVTCALVALVAIGAADEVPVHGLLVLVPLLLLYALPLAAFLLVIPATVATLVIFAAARVVRAATR